jgi:hypothetical protein
MNRQCWNTGDSLIATDQARKLMSVVGDDGRFSVATEEELYAEVARAWCRMHSPPTRVRFPMRPFAFGPDFAPAVWDQREDHAQEVVAVCAGIVSRRNPNEHGAQEVNGLAMTPGESLDPACAWWQPIPPDLGEIGVHFWVLGNGTVEIRSLAPLDEPPLPEYGRFASGRV